MMNDNFINKRNRVLGCDKLSQLKTIPLTIFKKFKMFITKYIFHNTTLVR